MGRPRNEKATVYKQWNVFLTEQDYAELSKCYKQSGCTSKVQFMCQISKYYDKITMLKSSDDKIIDELLEDRRALLGAATNINQIAKQVNILGYAAEEEDIRNRLSVVEEEVKKMREIAEKLLRKAYKVIG